MRKKTLTEMGALPPSPWDLALSCQDIRLLPASERAPCDAPRPISASESALRSHPCVALSSARLTFHIGRNIIEYEWLPGAAHTVTDHAGQICHQSSRQHTHSWGRSYAI